jgi:formate dehydrogenase major subunit
LVRFSHCRKYQVQSWPVYRQLTGADPLGRGKAVESPLPLSLTARTASAARVARSACPYCAVGCGQQVHVKDEKVVQIDLDTAMDMVTERVLDARRKSWQDTDENGDPLRRTMGLASLGGAPWTTKRTT